MISLTPEGVDGIIRGVRRSSRSGQNVPPSPYFTLLLMLPLTSADAMGTHRLSSMSRIFLETTHGNTHVHVFSCSQINN